MTETVKYPDVEVKLTERDGNAFAIIADVGLSLRRAGVSADEIAEFRREATSGTYDELLATVQRWVAVS